MTNFDPAKAIFSQVDTNRDGRIDPNEFRQWAATGGAIGGGAGSSSYESSSASFESSAGGATDAASTGYSFSNSAEASNAGSDGFALGGGASTAQFGGATGYEAAYSSQSGFESAGGASSSSAAGEFAQTSGVALGSNTVQQTTQYASSGGIYNDPNPQIIRRAAAGGAVTYQQKILVRFLQPPPVPPPGPLIIKEVRPPQPPPPRPLVVRQRAPALPTPPPLILRERPPVAPASIASQTVIRRLAAIPVPPRSVIIERLPPLPPKPRDIIIERWVPYARQAKRRTIVQRAAAAKEYQKPRNYIIMYNSVQARVVRQFQRFGVVQENPQAYYTRYGATLLDAKTLVQQARAAGVVEDISPPTASAAAQFSGSSFVGGSGGASFNASNAAFSQSSLSTSEGTGLEGLEVIGGAEAGTYGLKVASDAVSGNNASQSFSSSSSFGADGGATDGHYGAQSYLSSSNFGGNAGFDLAAASFASADTNRDGKLDQGEFQRFVQGGL